MMISKSLLTFLLLISVTSFADELSLSTVLESTKKHHPQILADYKKILFAMEEIKEKKGAFDTTLASKIMSREDGYYDGRAQEFTLIKELPVLGASVYGRYRISSGDFPIYEAAYETLDAGESAFGLSLSLWRYRDIDKNRYGVKKAYIKKEISKLKLRETMIKLTKFATKAYWEWVASANIYNVYKRLLDVAIERQSAIERRVKQGDLAAIYIVENNQYIAKRKIEVEKSKMRLKLSSISLSLYLRDEKGNMIRPEKSSTPVEFSLDKLEFSEPSEKLLDEIINQSPIISSINKKIEDTNNQIALSDNLLQPKVDLRLERAQDQGSGAKNLTQEDNKVYLSMEIPIERNLGSGQVAKFQAQKKVLSYQKKFYIDLISNKLSEIYAKILASLEINKNAKLEYELAEKLVKAENLKFNRGASDFFVVNLREQASANAQIKFFKSLNKYYSVMAEYQAILSGYLTK